MRGGINFGLGIRRGRTGADARLMADGRLISRAGRRRATAALAAVLAVGAGGAITLPGSAGATAPAAVGLRQASAIGRIGRNDVMTASVSQAGTAAPNGTTVQFQPSGGLLADHLYTAMAAQPNNTGYWLAAANGSVRNFGSAPSLAGISTDALFDPVVAIASTPTGNGFWLVTAGGEVTARGDAPDLGSVSQAQLNAPVLSIAVNPTGGFWLLAADGSVFTFGSSNRFHGSGAPSFSTGGFPTSIVSTPDGQGYWIVLSDGTIQAKGSASSTFQSFPVSPGDQVAAAGAQDANGLWAITITGAVLTAGDAAPLGNVTDANSFVIGFAPKSDGSGYWGLGADGQVLAVQATNYGDAFTATTRNGVASLAVTAAVPGPTTIDANSLGGTSPTLTTHWSFPPGYWLAGSDGGLFTFGDSHYFGSTGNARLAQPIVGMASTFDGGGYWLVASDGGVFAFGDAPFFGSTGNRHLAKPIVGMAATPDGGGYWLVASDGGIFAFGDAEFFGSTNGTKLDKPIVGMAPTPDGGGYWLVASDGGIFSLGDAPFFGSTGADHLAKPIVGMAATLDGGGYWLVASDGGIFAFGDAQFFGSTGGIRLNQPVVGMAPTPDGGGYWLTASDGGIFSFGNAGFAGSTGGVALNKPVVAMAADPGFFSEIQVFSRSVGARSYQMPTKLSPTYRMARWVESHR
jgi:hypothetical protein